MTLPKTLPMTPSTTVPMTIHDNVSTGRASVLATPPPSLWDTPVFAAAAVLSVRQPDGCGYVHSPYHTAPAGARARLRRQAPPTKRSPMQRRQKLVPGLGKASTQTTAGAHHSGCLSGERG
eukprot:CAMPEP_0174359258 /NCGR_PEP_ID=MMETSP0811_2-20130205/47479_1 /TAXON_ID=73025 ORGANISM="Eutreptiella gymnastica-like, Strain CCMP1594" /NCGR_SAMPLE_ID=MMETSP0811_2 /ASSEMBLY_ACC=CAM_ASM_000667 /LENGTH=120 /DNA_ID=CAMNT_0015493799 /DNA_START=145 /DNA_END=503 /DNA_ORIENTATION=+